jgi:hypothetical protein
MCNRKSIANRFCKSNPGQLVGSVLVIHRSSYFTCLGSKEGWTICISGGALPQWEVGGTQVLQPRVCLENVQLLLPKPMHERVLGCKVKSVNWGSLKKPHLCWRCCRLMDSAELLGLYPGRSGATYQQSFHLPDIPMLLGKT